MYKEEEGAMREHIITIDTKLMLKADSAEAACLIGEQWVANMNKRINDAVLRLQEVEPIPAGMPDR